MTFANQVALVGLGLIIIAGGFAMVRQHQIRRQALLEGATALLRRASTKWPTDVHAAIEAEQCAMVLERMAGAEHEFQPGKEYWPGEVAA